jgi:hypothetical protein
MDTRAFQQALRCARAVFADKQQHLSQKRDADLKTALDTLPRGGGLVAEGARVYVGYLNDTLGARADALLEACELSGVAFDDSVTKAIIEDVSALRTQILTALRNSLVNNFPVRGGATHIFRELDDRTGVPVARIRAEIEKRKLMAEKQKASTPDHKSSITHVYHLYGHNPRVNVDSTDRSVNVVQIPVEQVFARLREHISSHLAAGEEQNDILTRVEALEQAQNSPSFVQRYFEFMSVIADHISVIAPLIPALTELLQKHVLR